MYVATKKVQYKDVYDFEHFCKIAVGAICVLVIWFWSVTCKYKVKKGIEWIEIQTDVTKVALFLTTIIWVDLLNVHVFLHVQYSCSK